MRNYTYLEGCRFLVINIYRSQRFDVDRLDLNWIDDLKPEFVRGLRVVDHQDGNTVRVHGGDADNLIFSMAYISTTINTAAYQDFDSYLLACLESKEFLVTQHHVSKEEIVAEEVLH